MKKNILITTSSFDAEILSLFDTHNLKVILNPYKRKLTENEVAGLIQQYQPIGMIAGVEPLTGTVLKEAPFLKVISRCGIGMDSVDLVVAEGLGIKVTNTPDAPTMPVAELTIGLMISLIRSLHVSDSSIRDGHWARPMGSLLHGKTIGIIGCGRIGSYVAKILAAFGCNLVGYDPFCAKHDKLGLTTLENLLKVSDLVSLHLPYSEDNHYFINAERVALMKDGALLINASRGGLVDEKALVEALESGKLGGAAFDCFEHEPYTGLLAQLPNTLLTAHIGSYAREGRRIMEQQAVENLIDCLSKMQQIG